MMKSEYHVGQRVFFVQSGRVVKPSKIIKISGEFCTIKFEDTGGGIRVRQSKIFTTEEGANASIKEENKSKFDHVRGQSYKEYW